MNKWSQDILKKSAEWKRTYLTIIFLSLISIKRRELIEWTPESNGTAFSYSERNHKINCLENFLSKLTSTEMYSRVKNIIDTKKKKRVHYNYKDKCLSFSYLKVIRNECPIFQLLCMLATCATFVEFLIHRAKVVRELFYNKEF